MIGVHGLVWIHFFNASWECWKFSWGDSQTVLLLFEFLMSGCFRHVWLMNDWNEQSNHSSSVFISDELRNHNISLFQTSLSSCWSVYFEFLKQISHRKHSKTNRLTIPYTYSCLKRIQSYAWVWKLYRASWLSWGMCYAFTDCNW